MHHLYEESFYVIQHQEVSMSLYQHGVTLFLAELCIYHLFYHLCIQSFRLLFCYRVSYYH